MEVLQLALWLYVQSNQHGTSARWRRHGTNADLLPGAVAADFFRREATEHRLLRVTEDQRNIGPVQPQSQRSLYNLQVHIAGRGSRKPQGHTPWPHRRPDQPADLHRPEGGGGRRRARGHRTGTQARASASNLAANRRPRHLATTQTCIDRPPPPRDSGFRRLVSAPSASSNRAVSGLIRRSLEKVGKPMWSRSASHGFPLSALLIREQLQRLFTSGL